MSDSHQRGLRAEQVAQTRAALVRAGRHLFGDAGFASTSVDDLATEARVTTGALYHHFPTKAALFEAVFEQVHSELLEASVAAAAGETDEVEFLALGFEAFLDEVLKPDVARIVITDAPSVLGLERFVELDERYAYGAIADVLGRLSAPDPGTLARLFLGALTRGAMLIAGSPEPETTRDSVARAIRSLLGAVSTGQRRTKPPHPARPGTRSSQTTTTSDP